MFDIGWGELVVIGIVALIAIGPKELPGVLRTCGQWMGKIRRMAGEFQSQFQEAMREAEMADLKQQVDDLARSASTQIGTHFDPLETARKEVEDAVAGRPAASAGAVETPPVHTEPLPPGTQLPAFSHPDMPPGSFTQDPAASAPDAVVPPEPAGVKPPDGGRAA
jgi:sec-independent protein translocase protein TatB